jgi:transposase
MLKGNFTEEFKRDAVVQIVERGYRIAEVSQRLDVSQHSLYAWKKKFAKTAGSCGDGRDAELRRLKRGLVRELDRMELVTGQGPVNVSVSAGTARDRLRFERRPRRSACGRVRPRTGRG